MDTSVTDPPPSEPPGPDPEPSTSSEPAAPSGPSSTGSPTAGEWFASLYRSSGDRLLGGVCGGLAERFGVPVLLVRLSFVVAAFVGIGFPLYVLAWILLPNDRGERVTGHGPVRDLVVIGAAVVAGLVLLSEYRSTDYFSLFGRALPWFVVLAGVALVLRKAETGRPSGPPPPASPSASTPPLPPAGYTVMSPRPLPTPRPPRPPRPRPLLGPLTWCVVLLALGVMGLMAANDDNVVGPGIMAAVVMIVFGVGLTISAVRGRARGLILPAVAVGSLLAGLAALDVQADTTAGGFNRQVTAEGDLAATIESAYGRNVLDLRDLALTADRTVTIDQTVGTLRLILPRATSSKVIVHVGTGTAHVERPSVRSALMFPEVARSFADRGLPKAGAGLTSADMRRFVDHSWPQTTRSLAHDGAVWSVDRGSDATLTIDAQLGAGNLTIMDPRWTDVPDSIATPEQLCTVGGGPRGVVKACDEVPAAQRVALCINDAGYLVDCREDRNATIDFPRVAACRGYDGQQTDCSTLGIDPVGAELISPPGAEGSDPNTIAPADQATDGSIDDSGVPTETAPATDGTIAPPSPEPTVAPPPTTPPVPTVPPTPTTAAGA